MPKLVERLSPLFVSRHKEPGMYADGDGLYLQITSTKAKSWIYRYSHNGRAREMGLGPVRRVSLDEARKKARKCADERDAGHDPIDVRRKQRQQQKLDQAKAVTFRAAASGYINAHRGTWQNAKHAAQWESTLETYAYPLIGNVSVQDIDTPLVLRVLEQPIDGETFWKARPETAGRVRGRIETILDWATVREYRTGENPARWRGHLKKVLPEKTKVRKVKHHAALPYSQIAEFMTALRQQNGTAARALEFTILTAARTGETIGAKPREIAETDRTWTIPAERMKAKREHLVPLCGRAAALAREAANDAFLFPNPDGRALSNMAMAALLDRMGFGHVTVHGFRSTFKDWARDCTNFPNELSEAALAHTIKGKTEAAYARGSMFEKRRKLMEAWVAYCDRASPEVLTFRRPSLTA